MNISSVLRSISAANNLKFYHGPKDFQNMQDQKKNPVFPVCYQSLSRSRGIKTKQGFSGPEFIIELFLGDKTELSWEMEQHEEVIDRMDDIAHKYVNQLLAHRSIADVIGYDTVEAINIFDANLSGVILNVTIRVRDLRPNCTS